MDEQQRPEELKNHPPEEDARAMMDGVVKAFSIPWPRKPLGKPHGAGKSGTAHRGKAGHRGHSRRQKTPFWD